MMLHQLTPGTVVLVHATNWAAKLIQIGAVLQGKPGLYNHVAVVHHTDKKGTVWGIEGRPGGVGWVDMRAYLDSKYVLTNADQPKSSTQGAEVAEAMEALINTDYDWVGIGGDAISALCAKYIDPLWLPSRQWDSQAKVPGHVVCSSGADWAYEHVGLASPSPDRYCQPTDWHEFIINEGWE